MNFYELKRKNSDAYGGILLESVVSKDQRKKIRVFLFYATLASLLLGLLSLIGRNFSLSDMSFFNILINLKFVFRSLATLSVCLWVSMYLLEIMYLSFYFNKSQVDFEVLRIITKSDPRDITKTFLESEIGQYTLIRLGITQEQINKFLLERRVFVTEAEYEIIENDDDNVSFAEFGYSLIHFDSEFRNLLKVNGITAKDFKTVLDWVARIYNKEREEERWWTKERLARIPSLGRSWSFGQIYLLEKFGHSIYNDASYQYLGDKARIYDDSVRKIESILMKDKGANVILITRDSDFGMEVVASLGKTIVEGTVFPELEDKRIYVFDVNALLASYKEKSEFEKNVEKILQQSAKAGNVILVIPHLSDFVENSKHLETDIRDILNEAMSSNNLQIIALSNQRGFHQVLETDVDLMNKFEKIVIEELDDQAALIYAEDEALHIESHEGVYFTFQAIRRVLESADRYFSDSSISDKTSDILREVASSAREKGISFICEEEVTKVVEKKTGVPLGVLSEAEKQKLGNIEMILKKKVVGQERAIEAISNAMKRARLGVANPKRPLGSFLFIGPTGVGKTETSKALAEVFFGDAEDMIRIDMTEFNDSNAVARLIGDSTKIGILSSKVREKQYGVLLLDEFEKANPDVFNLFLQILDEGFFSDGLGERVNARNLIIIATSNAGSDLMYRAIEKQINLQSIKQEIIGHLITNKLLKPELINRFDDVVLFDSLGKENLKTIASMMIKRLNTRLENKGIDVEEDDMLLDYLVSKGTNETFGARELNRVIQKDIEGKIANALIAGTIQKGDTISFAKSGGDDVEIIKKN